MAEIVGALGVPHTPFFPALVEREGPECETARFFASVTRELEAMRPDLIVMYDTDHLNTFFFDNLPVFAMGVTDAFKGPNDEPRAVPIYTIKSRPDVAAHLHRTCVEGGFDLAVTQDFTVDHSVVVPLHFMTPSMRVPVIPIFVSGHVPPLPSSRRCYELGVAVKRAIESWREQLRVVVIGSGSFSLEVFGPRIAPGKSDGVPDPDWAKQVCALIKQGATRSSSPRRRRRSCCVPAMSAGSSSTGSPCSARSASGGRNSSRRRWSRGTPTPPGPGAEPCRSTP